MNNTIIGVARQLNSDQFPVLTGEIVADESISGELISSSVLTGEIVDIQSLSGKITTTSALTGELATGVTIFKDIELYDGSYEVTPLPGSDIVLNTANKGMTENLVVLEIPFYKTTNTSGGYTVIIGG